jgi:chaperonin GroES
MKKRKLLFKKYFSIEVFSSRLFGLLIFLLRLKEGSDNMGWKFLKKTLEISWRLTMAEAGKKTMNLKPLSNRIIAIRLDSKEILKGGLVLPDSAKKKQETAKVVAVGPGKKTEDGKILPMTIKVGDVILLEKYAGQEVTYNDQEYLIAKADDVIAIIEE